ncbi:MAG: carboxy-S-adenosyl-L-methionine synthase CmoA [Desulfuromonadaceae bacterium]|nr:carboxy-S-adenosyl-L-methionine synthase CmoA [Desulfuromonadaceae bacterium]
MGKDNLFAQPHEAVRPFEFNEQVVRVFDDMIKRSVPLYQESLVRQAQLAWRFYQPGTVLYDLGCSHGNFGVLFQAMAQERSFEMIAVDSSRPMLERYRQRLGSECCLQGSQRLELLEQSMQQVDFQSCSVVVINLTLQFVPVAERTALLERIYHALQPGGILLLTEKVEHPQPSLAELERTCYYDFKRENGYSELEISQKRDALENFLVPETCAQHEQRLRACGFCQTMLWLKWFNFASFLGIKS